MPEFRIIDSVDLDLSEALFVVGFPTTQYAGTIATNFLVESLGLDRIASVHSDDFPPMALVRHGKSLSPMRIHGAPMECWLHGECSKLAVLVSEVFPRPQNMYPLARALLEWARRKRVKKVVCIEGIMLPGEAPGVVAVEDAAVENPAPPDVTIYGVTNAVNGEDVLAALATQPLANGILSGFAGALLQLGETMGIDVLCLLPTAQGPQQDAHAAVLVVDMLRPMVPQIKIDPEPLRQQAEAMDRVLKKIVQRHQATMTEMSQQSHYMYG